MAREWLPSNSPVMEQRITGEAGRGPHFTCLAHRFTLYYTHIMRRILFKRTHMNSTIPRWRASKEMQQRARELRWDMTFAEKRLWQYLRNGQLDGAQFRKQHTVDTYIVDFFCAKSKLAIEVDGDSHAE